jgi:hypothetical protein
MRATIHMASAADYRLMAAATRAARQEWWLRTMRKELDGIDMAAVAAATRSILPDGPVPAAEIQARLAARGYPRSPGRASASGWTWSACRLRDVGAPEGGPVRAGGAVARRRRPSVGRGPAPDSAAGAAPAPAPAPGAIPARSRPRPSRPRAPARRLPGRFRPGAGGRHRVVGRPARRDGSAGGRAARPAPLLRRARPRALRPPRRAAAGRGHPGPDPLPADLGRDAARPRPPDRDPVGGAPAADLQHQDAALGADIPGGWPRGGNVALREGPRRSGPFEPLPGRDAPSSRPRRIGWPPSTPPDAPGPRRRLAEFDGRAAVQAEADSSASRDAASVTWWVRRASS